MEKPKSKRVNILVDKSFNVPLDSLSKINSEKFFNNNLEKTKDRLKKQYYGVRNSSIPLAPTQFPD